MARKPPNLNLRGVRARIPSGYLVGRSDGGDGRVQLIGPAELMKMFNIAGVAAAINPPPNPTVGMTEQGPIDDNEFIGSVNFTRTVVFRAGLPSSAGVCGTAPTGAVAFSLQKNGVEFATVNFAAGATVATFTCAADAQFDAGDVLSIYGPSPVDATFQDASFTIVGSYP